MSIILILIALVCPVLFLYLTEKSRVCRFLGAVTLSYLFGFLFSFLPIPYDRQIVQTAASVLIAAAIALILFGFDIRSVRTLTGRMLGAFVLMILSVCAVSVLASGLAARAGLKDAASLSGMAAALYIGGTPNLFCVGDALLRDKTLVTLASVADSVVGGIYFLFILTAGKALYRRILGKGGGVQDSRAIQPAEQNAQQTLPKSKKELARLVLLVLLAFACLGLGVVVEYCVNGSLEGSMFIIMTVSLAGIAFGCVRSIRQVKGSERVGQHMILSFSVLLGMSIDWTKLTTELLPVLIFFGAVQLASALVHFALCALFRVDGGAALITSVAGIYGPPFIVPTANAFGDRSLIAPGVVCGTLGLAVGNVIGLAIAGLLR